MKHEKKSATVIDFDAARKKRTQAASQNNFTTEPRSLVNKDGSVLVTLMNGAVIRTKTGDISLEGVKLRTSEATAKTLYAPGQFIDHESPTIEIAIDLPLPDGDLRLLACCRLVHLEMLSPEEVNFTLEFLAFVGAGEAILRHFLRICTVKQAPQQRNQAEVFAFEKGKGR